MCPVFLKGNKLLNNKIRFSNNIDINVIKDHINNSIVARLQNKNSNTDRLIYSSQDPYYNGIGSFTRNTSCWINGVSNISCFSPAQLSGESWFTRGGTLITKKHIILAKHYTIPILPNGGTPIIFVDENNNVIRRNIITYGYDSTDIAIGLLDSEIPNNIKIAKVLPSNYSNYINIAELPPGSSINETQKLSYGPYSIGLDQQEKALLTWTIGTTQNNGIMISTVSTLDPYISFSEQIIVGDSGNPVFLLIDNELVVLTTWLTPSSGPFISSRYNEINAIIENLSPGQGYSLAPIDLEIVYNKYS